MRTARRLAALALTLGLGTLAVAPARAQSTSTSPSAAANTSTFTVGTLAALKTINPIKALNGPEYEFLALNYDLGLQFGIKDLAPVPGLVTTYSHTPDGMTWIYKVRTGATFQDGTPLTANDIAFTYDFMVKNNISAFSNYFPFTKSITATDPTTVTWETTKPTMAPQYPPWVYILPQHIWGGFTAKQASNYEKVPVVGTGAFQLVEWNKGENWKFKANDSYWGGAPHIKNLIFQQFANPEAMVNALKTGQIDFAENIPTELFKSLQHTPGISTNVAAPTIFDQLSFGQVPFGHEPPGCNNCGKSTTNPILQDPQVRLAIAHAIDKQTLVSKVLGGYGVPGQTFVPVGFSQWHYTIPADQQINFSIDQANQILDQAGYTKTSSGGTWTPSCNCTRVDPRTNKPLKFRFMVITSEQAEVKDAPYIQGWLKQIGISINPQVVTEGKLVDLWYANDYDMYMWGWGPDPDPDFMSSTFTTGQCEAWSDTCFSDPTYDRLYQQQRTAIDPTARKQILDQMQQIIYEKIPEIVLYYSEDLQAYNSRQWTGFVNQPQPQGYKLFAYGNYSYLRLRPNIGAAGSSGSGGVSGIMWLAIVAGLVIVIGGIAFARRRSEEERA